MGVYAQNAWRKAAAFADPDRRIRDLVRELRGRYRYRGTPITPANLGNQRISHSIANAIPFSAGKIGATELRILARHTGIIKGQGRRYTDSVREEIFINAGVYPVDDASLDRFSERWIADCASLDLLAVWYNSNESDFVKKYITKSELTTITALEPYYFQDPWSESLEGKKVLVVSPLSDSIEHNFNSIRDIWAASPKVFPDCKLETVKFPYSAAISGSPPREWFATLARFEDIIAAKDFDVALIGAGATSVPLCAHVKRLGKIGLHLGGQTQVLFGIRGARWDNHPVIRQLFNDCWTRPMPHEVPTKSALVENGCYW